MNFGFRKKSNGVPILSKDEIDDYTHLGYEKHAPAGDHSGNSRNGYSPKTLQTQMGKSEIKVPRDRNGEFEPQIIKKYETADHSVRQKVEQPRTKVAPVSLLR